MPAPLLRAGLLLLAAAAGAARAALTAARLKPDGSHAVAPDGPVRFRFAPVDSTATVGTELIGFRLWVRSAGGAFVSERVVAGPVPELELPGLQPGRYRWGVQWWSANASSAEAEAEVLVAPRGDAWDGVPWLGAQDANEFRLEARAPAGGDAELLVATLGFGYATVNGHEVSKDVLGYSGWTNTDRRVLYRSYNVTGLLGSDGAAQIFVGLGCGYRCDAKGVAPRAFYPQHMAPNDTVPKVFRLQLRVGGKLVAHSGSPGWQSRAGPVVDDSLYDGETYNQTAATGWAPAPALAAGHGPAGAMVPAGFPGVQVTRMDAPVAISEPAPGVFVVDFGSDVAGVCRISIPSAATVVLRHGEVLQHSSMPGAPEPQRGRVYFGNLRSAKQTDIVVAAGPLKDWWPRFTYHGFRYVEVTGFPGTLTAGDISRLRLHTAVESKARANFSDDVLQAIHEGSRGSQLSNLMQLPTDCPQRDERLGWMGDASLSAESMFLHFDYAGMATAFVDSMIDAMGDDGNLPDIVPLVHVEPGRPGDSSWTSAFVEILTQAWKVDGDLEPARVRWPAVLKHVASIEAAFSSQNETFQRWPEHYGDWCPPPQTPGGPRGASQEEASRGFSAAFSAAHTALQAAELAEALGLEVKANFSALASRMREAFHSSFFRPATSSYDTGTMVSYVLPLALGAVPPDADAAVFQGLLDHIARKNGTWSGGIINNRFLFDVLADRGHADLALAMLRRRDYPSYGYMYFNDLEPAKECMWELPDAPFQGDGMNSRNHHMFSSVGSYLVRRLAGLTRGSGAGELTAAVGPRGLKGATAHLTTPRGEATWAWSWAGDSLSADILVPVGMRAQVLLPASLDVRLPPTSEALARGPCRSPAAASQQITLPSGRHSLTARPGYGERLFV